MPNIDLSILNQRQTPAFFADTLANRPAAGFLGRIFIATDTKEFYRDTGTTWEVIGGGGTGTITGSGVSGQVAYFNGTSSITSNAALGFTPTSELLINNSVNASTIGRGSNLTSSLTATANNDLLIGLDIVPTFSIGAFTGIRRIGARINNHYFWNGLGNQSTTLAIGSESMKANTSIGNTAIGFEVGFNNAGFQNSVLIGYQAGYVNPANSGGANTIIGYQAGYHGSFNENTFIGYQAGHNINGVGRRGVAIGHQAAFGSGTQPDQGEYVFIGRRAGFSVTSIVGQPGNSSLSVGIGSSALQNLTTGVGNTAIGQNSLLNITTTSTNIAIGLNSGRYIGSGASNTISSNSVYIGIETRASLDGNTNEVIIAGYDGVNANTGLGSNTTTIGNSATTTTAIYGGVLIGTTTTGTGKLVVESAVSDNGIQIVGANAPSLRFDNLKIGATKRAGLGISTAVNNFIQGSIDQDFCVFNSSATSSPILFGIYDVPLANTQEAARISAARNFLIGTSVDSGNRLSVNGSVAFSGSVTNTGNSSNFTVTASSNIARSKSITSTLIASANTDILVGLDINPTFTNGAFSSITNAGIRISNTLYLGTGRNNNSGNIVFGSFTSGRSISTGANNILIGRSAGQTLTTGGNNTAIGDQSLAAASTSSNNTAVGSSALVNNTGSGNTAVGASSISGNGAGSNNTAIGLGSLSNITSGSNNASMGGSSANNLTTGSNNISAGYLSGRIAGSGATSNATSSGSIYIGYDTRSSANGNNNEIVISGYIGSGIGAVGLGTNTTSIGNSSTTFTALYGNLLVGTQTNGASRLRVVGLPTSSAGLSSGDVWNNAGVLNIVP